MNTTVNFTGLPSSTEENPRKSATPSRGAPTSSYRYRDRHQALGVPILMGKETNLRMNSELVQRN